MTEMMNLLPTEDAARVRAIISEREATAGVLLTTEFVAFPKEATCGEVLRQLRTTRPAARGALLCLRRGSRITCCKAWWICVSWSWPARTSSLADLMVSPAVAAEVDDVREDLVEMFLKYHFRILPVVDRQNHLLGVCGTRIS